MGLPWNAGRGPQVQCWGQLTLPFSPPKGAFYHAE